MLHKWETMVGLPEDSLSYGKEVRRETSYHKSSKEGKSKNKGEKK